MRQREVVYVARVLYPVGEAFIANTDKAWFDFLSSRAVDGSVDEVNFWLPRATRPMREMLPGEPMFFRLKRPNYAICGYGFFAHFRVLDLDACWDLFGWKNGDPDKLSFLSRIGGYRRLNLLDPLIERAPIGCTVLRDVRLWPRERWMSWGEPEGWAPNIVQGKTERDPVLISRLMAAFLADQQPIPEEFSERFVPLEVDERSLIMAETRRREGQGTFRLRILDAYGGRCAITGEHTEPVLDAAHIQPYLGPGSNHVQNGMLLTKEFHTLFDRGYVAVTPELEVRVSPRLRSEWNNGARYYPYDGKALVVIPNQLHLRPSEEALDWHYRHVFRKSA